MQPSELWIVIVVLGVAVSMSLRGVFAVAKKRGIQQFEQAYATFHKEETIPSPTKHNEQAPLHEKSTSIS